MLSPLQQHKLDNHFRLLDQDADGLVSRADYLATAARICEVFGLDASSPQGRELHDRHVEIFDIVAGEDPDAALDAAGFHQRLGRSLSDDAFGAAVESFATAIVTSCDADGDAELSAGEFRRLLCAWGLTAEDADAAFDRLDLDLSGHLSAGEVAEALDEFYRSDDPDAPGNWLYGPVEDGRSGPRIPYPAAEELPESARQVLEALPQLNMFRMLAHAHSVFPSFMQLAKAVYTELELPGDLRELAVLQVANDLGGGYVWTQHVSAAQAERTPRPKIVAVRAGRLDAPCLTEAEQACLAFTAEVLHRNRASDSTFDRLSEHLTPRQIVELLIVVGSYTLVCRLSTALEIDHDRSLGDAVVGDMHSG